MKRILITCWAMEIGGVERSLISLLETLDYTKYKVDLFLCRHEGELLSSIPDNVHLLPEIKGYALLQKSIKEGIKNRSFNIVGLKAWSKFKVKWHEKRGKNTIDSLLTYYTQSGLAFLPYMSPTTYDLAISFLAPHYLTRYKVKAAKYVAWIHTDYNALSIDYKAERKMWEAYDEVVGVSKECIRAFNEVFPNFKKPIREIENILSPSFIRKQAEAAVVEEMPEEDGVIKLCTVGRFCAAKAFDLAAQICKQLVDNGCSIKWYIIGYGSEEMQIKALIKELHIEPYFILLGKKVNPYPYIKACDFYIQPSRYEGKAVAVREAQILGKVPIITNFNTATSQVENGKDGIIVPMELQKCALHIQAIIHNNVLKERIVRYISNKDYGNQQEIYKVYQLLEGVQLPKVKVLHCIGKMNCGGAETMLMNIYRYMDKEHLEFSFLVHHEEGEGYYDEEIKGLGGSIYALPSQGKVGIVGYVHRLKQFIEEEGPFDVIHSHMDWQGGLISLVAKRMGVKKIIVHAHTSSMMKYGIHYQLLLRVQKLLIGICATDYWACSKVAAHFLFYRFLCSRAKIKIIPNAIDLSKYKHLNKDKVKAELQIPPDYFLLGNVGSLSPIKNQDFLLEVAFKLKERHFPFKLLLIGKGETTYKEALLSKIRRYHLEEQVILLGQRTDIPEIMHALDLFLLPSLFEGLGIVAVEAQAAATTCIVSKMVPKEIDMGLRLIRWMELEVDKWVKTIFDEVQESKKEEILLKGLSNKALNEKGYNILKSVRKIEDSYLSM